MMNYNIAPTIILTPTANSFPFPPKRILLPQGVKLLLECQTSKQVASTENGFFPWGSLTLSAPHAEVWTQGKHVMIRDRASAHGTHVNGMRIEHQTLLQDGDIMTLGVKLSGSSGQKNLSDVQYKPIEAHVSILGL